MRKCSGYHPVSTSQFCQNMDISPLGCQSSIFNKHLSLQLDVSLFTHLHSTNITTRHNRCCINCSHIYTIQHSIKFLILKKCMGCNPDVWKLILLTCRVTVPHLDQSCTTDSERFSTHFFVFSLTVFGKQSQYYVGVSVTA